MQRVRIGLTGLAFVFVLVLLAAVFSGASDEQPITPNSLQQQISPSPGADIAPVEESAPTEPLAELGVAPGAAEAGKGIDNSQIGATPR